MYATANIQALLNSHERAPFKGEAATVMLTDIMRSHIEANRQIAVLRASLTATIRALDLADQGDFDAAVAQALLIGRH